LLCLLALVGAALTGCGSRQSTVSGQVTLDGTPLASGTIAFVPADGATASAETLIKDGSYSLPMPPGSKRVQISATKVIGKRVVYEGDPNSPVIDNLEQIIPPQYNAATTLSFEAKAGSARQNFSLTSH
jgi:hypothetical protein